jgi:hypothetical protein
MEIRNEVVLRELVCYLTTEIDPESLATVIDRIITDYSLLLLERGEQGRFYTGHNASDDIFNLVQVRDILRNMTVSQD